MVSASAILKMQNDSIKASFANGNLYYTVDILYPWAVYYMYTLDAITNDRFRKGWFAESPGDNDHPLLRHYDKHQAERDEALLIYFVQLLWETIASELPSKVRETIRGYTSLYTKHDYYMAYPDMYIEWLCTYWVKAAADRNDRRALLPLLLLELSSIEEEDEDDVREELAEIEEKLKMLEKKKCETEEEKEKQTSEALLTTFSKTVKEATLACLKMYGTQLAQASEVSTVPFQSMEEYMYNIHRYVEKKGPFYRDTYDDYLDSLMGVVDWDALEW